MQLNSWHPEQFQDVNKFSAFNSFRSFHTQYTDTLNNSSEIHTIDDPRVGGGGAGTLRCGGNGGAILLVLTFGLRSFAIDKLFALPVPVVAGV